jgi:hypothetical protein
MVPPPPEGGTVTVWVSVAELRATLEPRGAETFTARLELAESSLRPSATNNTTKSTAPISPSGINAQVGKPSDCRGTSVTTVFLSMTGRAFIGRPQLGQATAEVDISCPHSGQ